MGEVTRILVTGASGFVGRAVVAEARARGLHVVAVMRSHWPSEWDNDPGITKVTVDLAAADALDTLRPAMNGVGAVIHTAAHLGGDAATHDRDTLAGTQAVLSAMLGQDVRLVLVSSIAVYDTMQLQPGDTLTEESPLEHHATARDAYAGAKLRQEALCRVADHPMWILRPGAIYGPGRTWHALMGPWVGPLHIQIASDGELPMTHVRHCAWALVQAALTDPGGVQIANVLDDDRPTRARYLAAHSKAAGWPRWVLPVPFHLWHRLARLLAPLNLKRPGLLSEPILRARMMPLSYPNSALRAALGVADDAPFETMLTQSLEGGT